MDVLPLIKPLREYLLSLKARQEADKEQFQDGYYECDYICRWNDGRLILPNYVSQTLKRVLEKNNLRPTRFHDIRHFVGTQVLAETGDIKLASSCLRHSNISITSDTYVDARVEYKRQGFEVMDKKEAEG